MVYLGACLIAGIRLAGERLVSLLVGVDSCAGTFPRRCFWASRIIWWQNRPGHRYAELEYAPRN
jgi:hypothetical protein